MTQYKISDQNDPRKYFTQVPNIIDDMSLTVYAFRLYVHLKRVAADTGICWQSAETLSESCKMSTASISRAKQELLDRELIEISEANTPHGGRPAHNITIIDIWEENIKRYSSKTEN